MSVVSQSKGLNWLLIFFGQMKVQYQIKKYHYKYVGGLVVMH